MFVSINYLTIRVEDRAHLHARFDEVKKHLHEAPGFQRFRLLQPRAEAKQWLVYTEWDDAEAYESWKASSLYDRMHPTRSAAGGHPGGQPGGHPGHPQGGAGSGELPLGSDVVHYDVASELLAARR